MSVELNAEQLEVISRTVIEHLEQKEKQRQKQKRDRRLRNMKLLLRNYRAFALHCEEAQMDIVELDEKLEDLEEFETDRLALESLKKSKRRTLAMVRHINRMLEVYRILCEQSGRLDEKRKYQALLLMYISEQKLSIEQIAKLQNTSPRTVYNDLESACETLSRLVFGVDSLLFSS